MKQNGLVFLIFSLWLMSFCGVLAQTSAECLLLATKAETANDPTFALTLYERVRFFAPQQLSALNYASMGRCYVAQGAFEAATACFESASTLVHTDSLRTGLLLKATWCQLMQQRFQEAQVILFGLPEILPPSLEREKAFYTGIAHFGLAQFSEAERSFLVCFPDSADQKWLRSVFAQNERLPRRYNAKRAKLLSTFIPGAGQLYIGDVKNGLNSFLLTSGLVVLGIQYILYYSWIDSLVSIAPWFQRYYMGGRNRAGLLAEAKLRQKRQALLDKIISR
jgi:tetratricopeptide (TPR) repeat protein